MSRPRPQGYGLFERPNHPPHGAASQSARQPSAVTLIAGPLQSHTHGGGSNGRTGALQQAAAARTLRSVWCAVEDTQGSVPSLSSNELHKEVMLPRNSHDVHTNSEGATGQCGGAEGLQKGQRQIGRSTGTRPIPPHTQARRQRCRQGCDAAGTDAVAPTQ